MVYLRAKVGLCDGGLLHKSEFYFILAVATTSRTVGLVSFLTVLHRESLGLDGAHTDLPSIFCFKSSVGARPNKKRLYMTIEENI